MEGFLIYRLPFLACFGALIALYTSTRALASHMVQKFRAHTAAKPMHTHTAARG